MNIELRDIDSDNFLECVLLKSEDVKGYHLFERNVTSNAFSIAQSRVEPNWIPKAIYAEDKMVGFAMYGFEPKYKFYFITRLMIHYKYQGKGYGKQAMLKIIDEIKKFNCAEVYTSIVPTNAVAEHLYTSIGFISTGRTIEFGGEYEPLFSLKF